MDPRLMQMLAQLYSTYGGPQQQGMSGMMNPSNPSGLQQRPDMPSPDAGWRRPPGGGMMPGGQGRPPGGQIGTPGWPSPGRGQPFPGGPGGGVKPLPDIGHGGILHTTGGGMTRPPIGPTGMPFGNGQSPGAGTRLTGGGRGVSLGGMMPTAFNRTP